MTQPPSFGPLSGTTTDVASSADVIALLPFWEAIQEALQAAYRYRVRKRAAVELFQSIFMVSHHTGPNFGVSLGRRKYRSGVFGYHPDNWVGATALADPLGLPRPTFLSQSSVEIPRHGNLFVFGGPNSTAETMIAWEFEGANDSELFRPEDLGRRPLIPLRWYGISASSHPAALEAGRIAYIMPGGRPTSSTAWPIADVRKGRVDHYYKVRVGPKRLSVQGQELRTLASNFLVVTQLPNFVAVDLSTMHRAAWPYMLVFDGSNGIGTRASQLLTRPRGLEALQDAAAQLRGARYFQLLFEVYGLRRNIRGFHRFSSVRLVDAQPLDKISLKTYRAAHLYAQRRLAQRDVPWVAETD